MRGTLAEQVKATIYQYQLIRKMSIHKEYVWSHFVIAFVLVLFQLTMYRLEGLIAIGISIALLQVIHFIIIRLTLIRVDEPNDKRWGLRLTKPWFGYIPTAYIELALYRKIHRHLLWLGLCAIGVIYPWANEAQMIALISWHLWFLAPRLLILRPLRKCRPDGVLKFQPTEVNFYHR